MAARLGALGDDRVDAGRGAGPRLVQRRDGREDRDAGRARELDDLARVAQRGADDASARREGRLDSAAGASVGGAGAGGSGASPSSSRKGATVACSPASSGLRRTSGGTWTLTPTGPLVSSTARLTASCTAAVVMLAMPKQPRPPAELTAAMSSGGVQPPAIGASSTGWWMPRRSQSGVWRGLWDARPGGMAEVSVEAQG